MANTTTETPAPQPTPSEDQIRRRADEIYRLREAGNTPGTAEGDWHQAERELQIIIDITQPTSFPPVPDQPAGSDMPLSGPVPVINNYEDVNTANSDFGTFVRDQHNHLPDAQ